MVALRLRHLRSARAAASLGQSQVSLQDGGHAGWGVHPSLPSSGPTWAG